MDKKHIFFAITVGLETFIFYTLFIIPFEYFLTEKYPIMHFISSDLKSIIFLVFFIIFFSLNYSFKKIRLKSEKIIIPLSLLFIITIFGFKKYTSFYSDLRKGPRIYEVNVVNNHRRWGIQGDKIEIYGTNFGDIKKGSVYIHDKETTLSPIEQKKEIKNDFKLEVQVWQNDKIIAEQPVPPKFFRGQLYVVNYQGDESNKLDYQVRNPTPVLTAK